MVGGSQRQSGHVGHCQSDKRNRTAERSGDGCQDAGSQQQDIPYAPDVDAEIFGVPWSEQHGIKRFDEHDRHGQSDDCKQGEGRQLVE